MTSNKFIAILTLFVLMNLTALYGAGFDKDNPTFKSINVTDGNFPINETTGFVGGALTTYVGSAASLTGVSATTGFQLKSSSLKTITIEGAAQPPLRDGRLLCAVSDADLVIDLDLATNGGTLGATETRTLYVDTAEAVLNVRADGRKCYDVANTSFHSATADIDDVQGARYFAIGTFTTDGSSNVSTTASTNSVSHDSFKNVNMDAEPCGVIKWSSVPLTAAEGYVLANGDSVLKADYPCLDTKYSAESYLHGTVDGTHFNLPDIEGKQLVGQDTGQTEFDVIGETSGEKTHALTTAEVGPHNHGINHDHPSDADAAAGQSLGTSNISLASGSAPTTGSEHTHTMTLLRYASNTFTASNKGWGSDDFTSGGTVSNTTDNTGAHSHSVTGTTNIGHTHGASAVDLELFTGTSGTSPASTAHNVLDPYLVERAYIKYTYPTTSVVVPNTEFFTRITSKNTSGKDSKHQVTGLPGGFTGRKDYTCEATRHDDGNSHDFPIVGAIYHKTGTGTVDLNLDAYTVSGTDYVDLVCGFGARAVAIPLSFLTNLSSTTTLLSNDFHESTVLLDSTGGAFTVTLPAASEMNEHFLILKKISSDNTLITIDGSASETIDDSLTYGLYLDNEFIRIQSNGSNWFIAGRIRRPVTAIAYQTTPQLYTTGSFSRIDFDTISTDTHSAISGSGASWQFTAPRSGKYLVFAGMGFQASAAWGANEELLFTIGGNVDINIIQGMGLNSNGTNQNLSREGGALIELPTGGIVHSSVRQSSGANQTIEAGSNRTFIRIVEVID